MALHCRRHQEGGKEEVVQLLAENGADFNAPGGYYDNALQAALENGNEKALQFLVEHGAKFVAQRKY